MTNIARRHATAVSIEGQSQIFVHQNFDVVAIVRCEEWQRPNCLGLEAVIGELACLAMLATVGDSPAPSARIRVETSSRF
jgi:hypothetical protein